MGLLCAEEVDPALRQGNPHANILAGNLSKELCVQIEFILTIAHLDYLSPGLGVRIRDHHVCLDLDLD